jgi:serine/threonine-protein kinase TTK/MPS1
MIYGQAPFASLSVLGRMKAIPDPTHAIEFAEVTAPFLPNQTADLPHQRPRDWSKKTIVPEVVQESLRSCLCRNPKERATIPELLANPWLTDNLPVKEVVKEVEVPSSECPRALISMRS